MKTWGIVGLGWLGKSLATALETHGINYWGTTTRDFKWGVDTFPGEDCDYLFLNTPPLTGLTPHDYVKEIPPKDWKKVIFISSTSVYGEHEGRMTEETPVNPQTANSQWLCEVEDLLIEKFADKISIIRPGGLIGEDRHPVRSLSARSSTVDRESLINFIHQEDLIRIILRVSSLGQWPVILNAVCPYHPTKQEYYDDYVAKLNLSSLKYRDGGIHRLVDSLYLGQIYKEWLHPRL